jgi:hypothetical protein
MCVNLRIYDTFTKKKKKKQKKGWLLGGLRATHIPQGWSHATLDNLWEWPEGGSPLDQAGRGSALPPATSDGDSQATPK